jgi:type IV secretion system protein VirB3
MSAPDLGLELPLHSSLANPILLGGVPRSVAIVNATLAAVLCLGLQQPLIGAPVALAVHIIAGMASRTDIYLHMAAPRHLAVAPFLDA